MSRIIASYEKFKNTEANAFKSYLKNVMVSDLGYTLEESVAKIILEEPKLSFMEFIKRYCKSKKVIMRNRLRLSKSCLKEVEELVKYIDLDYEIKDYDNEYFVIYVDRKKFKRKGGKYDRQKYTK